MKGKEYKASHILVDSEDKAKEVIAELKKGGKFAELAKAKSSDSSAANGGDLGWFTPSMMVPPFAQAVAKMERASTVRNRCRRRSAGTSSCWKMSATPSRRPWTNCGHRSLRCCRAGW